MELILPLPQRKGGGVKLYGHCPLERSAANPLLVLLATVDEAPLAQGITCHESAGVLPKKVRPPEKRKASLVPYEVYEPGSGTRASPFSSLQCGIRHKEPGSKQSTFSLEQRR